jgi:hypothetical protein
MTSTDSTVNMNELPMQSTTVDQSVLDKDDKQVDKDDKQVDKDDKQVDKDDKQVDKDDKQVDNITETPEDLIVFYTTLICSNLFTFLFMIKMIHWQTRSFAIHKSTDKLYEKINELMDDLVETIQGELLAKYESRNLDDKQNYKSYIGKVVIGDCKIDVTDQTEKNSRVENYLNLLQRFESFLVKQFKTELIEKVLSGNDNSAIYNIRDEMVSALQKARYLSTLE